MQSICSATEGLVLIMCGKQREKGMGGGDYYVAGSADILAGHHK